MNRDDLIKQFSVKTEVVKVTGIEVTLKEMSGRDRDEYFMKLAQAERITTVIDGEETEIPNVTGVKGFLISRLVVDDDLNPSLSQEDVDKLSVEFTDEVFEHITEMNKLADVDIDDAEKN
jgi:hypothetical protein